MAVINQPIEFHSVDISLPPCSTLSLSLSVSVYRSARGSQASPARGGRGRGKKVCSDSRKNSVQAFSRFAKIRIIIGRTRNGRTRERGFVIHAVLDDEVIRMCLEVIGCPRTELNVLSGKFA